MMPRLDIGCCNAFALALDTAKQWLQGVLLLKSMWYLVFSATFPRVMKITSDVWWMYMQCKTSRSLKYSSPTNEIHKAARLRLRRRGAWFFSRELFLFFPSSQGLLSCRITSLSRLCWALAQAWDFLTPPANLEGFANWSYSLRCKGQFFCPDWLSRQQVPTVADFSAHTRSCIAICWDRSIGYAVFVLDRWITWNLAETKVYVGRNWHGSLWSSIRLSFKPEESSKQSYEMKMVSGCESSQQLGDGSALAAHSSQCRTMDHDFMVWEGSQWLGLGIFVDEDWSLPRRGARPFLGTKLGVTKSEVEK